MDKLGQGDVRNRRMNPHSAAQQQRAGLLENNTEALIDNPLLHLSPTQLDQHVRAAFTRWGLPRDLLPLFIRAGLVAQSPDDFNLPALSKEERRIFRAESKATFWDQSKQLKITIFACCLGAIVQGWNQTGSNGANLTWTEEFKLQLGNATTPANTLDTWSYAAVNAAPFLSASLAGCWLSDPLNEFFYGRRGATFIAAIFCLTSVIGAACTHRTKDLLGCRILLGIGMGAKASVIPIYAAEVSPYKLRGSLVMNWQLFTALGQLLGFSANLALANIEKLGWRLQMASAFLPTIPLMALIFCCPESPRFLMKKGQYQKAYRSLVALRGSQISAAKDMIYLDAQIQATEAKLFSKYQDVETIVSDDLDDPSDRAIGHNSLEHDDRSSVLSLESVESEESDSEDELSEDPPSLTERFSHWVASWFKADQTAKEDPMTFQSQFKLSNYWQRIAQLVTVPRTRRACLAAFVVMISQQLCAINILAFYSSTLFRDTDVKNSTGHSLTPLWYSWVCESFLLFLSGYGLTNFLFAFPAYPLIDRKGRRYLLLVTFPLMALTLLAAAFSYYIRANRSHTIVIYFWFILFTMFYSPGAGPVPFTYSSEVFPLVNREAGMSFAVFWNLFGAGLLALFVPSITSKWGETRLLCLFAGLCTLAFCLIFVFVPETTGRTLEEINYIFGVPTRKHASYQLFEVLPWAIDHYLVRHITRKVRVQKPAPLMRWWQKASGEAKEEK